MIRLELMPISVRMNRSSAVPLVRTRNTGKAKGEEEVYNVLWVTTEQENNTMYDVGTGIVLDLKAIRRVNALER